MRKLIVTAALVGALAVTAVPAASGAGSAHFIKNATGATLSGSNLVCNFKEAGLASGSVENVTCSATVSTSYECVNGGGVNPRASNKRTFKTTVSRTQPFTADKNGNLVGSITLSPPTAAQLGFSCPPGQTTTFVGVTYSGVRIVDQTSGASIGVSGTFSYRNPAAP